MANISARATKTLWHNGKISINVYFKVGNCKLNEDDLDTLIRLQKVCRENPVDIIDCRINNLKV